MSKKKQLGISAQSIRWDDKEEPRAQQVVAHVQHLKAIEKRTIRPFAGCMLKTGKPYFTVILR